MFGWGSKENKDAAAPDSTEPPPAAAAAAPRVRTLASLIEEELPIQRHSVAMQGGMPSCLTLFDQFFLCYSLGSQIKSVYRHGTPRDCMPKFEDFKFCMSIKGVSNERRDELWVRRRAEWWARRRLGKSSEDVWNARRDVYTDPLEEKKRQQRAAEPAFAAEAGTVSGTSSPPPSIRSRPTTGTRSLEGSLSEEVLLRCLSFLRAHDLVTVSRVSSAWYRLAQDPQLWRDLYLSTYASPSTRRRAEAGLGPAPPPRSRPWRELYQISTNWRNGSARATTLGTELRKAVLPPVPSTTDVVDRVLPPSTSPRPPSRTEPPATATAGDDTLLQFHQQYIFSASRTATTAVDPVYPTVTVHQTLPAGGSAVVGSFGSDRLRHFYRDRPDFRPKFTLSEMRLDGGHGSIMPLMALFYSTGQYALFRLELPSSSEGPAQSFFSATEVYTSLTTDLAPRYHDPSSPTESPSSSSSLLSPFDPVSTARLHWPLLVTLTESLTLRFLRLCGDRDSGPIEVDETETPLQSRERWAPVVLSVVPTTNPSRDGDGTASGSGGGSGRKGDEFSVSLAYSMPVFPASWTVGLQQFDVAVTSCPKSALVVVRARHATALPVHTPLPATPRRTTLFPGGSAPEAVAPLLLRRTASPSPVTSIEHSHPFIVTSRIDNTIDVYEVVRRPWEGSSVKSAAAAAEEEELEVVHRRTLFGHTARVSSVALLPATIPHVSARRRHAEEDDDEAAAANIRCVSAGDDGAVKVWQLSPSSSAPMSPLPSSSSTSRRKRTAADADLQVRIRDDDQGDGDADPPSDWQHMKRRRAATTVRSESGLADERPPRVRRLWVAEDKIVLLQQQQQRDGGPSGAQQEEERLQVLRFD
ncbi:hypothetical protein JCM3774_005017 [Rhodotorula dairenensis]